MSKQILKGFTMLMLVVGLAFVSAVVSANGQGTTEARANIPFQFIVGDKSLPAGKYAVRPNKGSRVVAIDNRDSQGSARRLTSEIMGNRKENARLVFHRYGNRYFLAEVWMGEPTGIQLAKSREERVLERELASLASNGESGRQTFETIAIVLSPR